MLQRDGVVMVDMKVLVMEMMMMMIPMKSGAMVMTMATISPLREGISQANFSLPESFSLPGVFRPVEAAVSNSKPPFRLRFSGTMKENSPMIFKIWSLDGLFSIRILTPAANPPMIIKHVKIKEIT
jgi:hypothetical protein